MEATIEAVPVIETLREKVAQLKLSNSEIARLSRKSTSTVSQVLNGKYDGRPEVIKEILSSITEHSRTVSEAARGSVRWLTAGEELIEGILKLTYYHNGFSAIVGPSGLGKTFTAKLFAAEHPGVVYTRCNDGMGMGDTVQILTEITGVTSPPGYATKTRRMKRAIQALKEIGVKMLLVDEADLLVSDHSNKLAVLKKISVFREVKESGIGVAMIGLESFDDTLRLVGETYVTSRIDYFRRVKDPTPQELAYYMARQGWDPELPDAKQVISLAPKRGSLRFLEKLAQTGKYLGSLAEALAVTYAAGGHIKEV